MRLRPQRKHLERQRSQEIAEAADRLSANPEADVEKNLQRIEIYTRLLTAMPKRWSHDSTVAVLAAVLSLTLAGLLWGLPVRHMRVTLSLQSETVAMKLQRPWTWRGNLPIHGRRVELAALGRLASPDILPVIQSEQRHAWLRIRSGKVALEKFHLGQNGTLELDTINRNQLEMYARDAPVEGQLMVWGDTTLQAGTAHDTPQTEVKRQIDIPETIVFEANGQGAIPVKLRIDPVEPWLLRNIPIRELRFVREIPTDSEARHFVSTIQGGTVTLTDVAKEVTLREQDELSLAGVGGRLVEVRGGDHLDLRFEGTVRDLLLGPKGFQRSLAPSLLHYYYHQEPLSVFWGAVVFLWGILWGMRKTLLR